MRRVGLEGAAVFISLVMVTAMVSAQTVSGSAVREAVASYIKQSLPPSLETSLEFEHLRKTYPVGYKKCRLVVSSANSVTMKGPVTFLVKARGLGGEIGYTQVIPVTVRIRTFQKVLVAMQTINPHSTIERDEVSAVKTETTEIQNPVTSLSQLKGKWTTCWIQSGKALTFNMLAEQPVIKQGQNITIVYRTKNITVSDQGSALQDGKMGQIIRVANEYRKSLRARVVSSDEVVLVN